MKRLSKTEYEHLSWKCFKNLLLQLFFFHKFAQQKNVWEILKMILFKITLRKLTHLEAAIFIYNCDLTQSIITWE